MKSPLPTERFAFTLLELLLSVGVVTILAVLLFPTVSRTVRSSKQATCAANLRAFGTAILSLVSDKGELPSPGINPVTGEENERTANYWGWVTSGSQPYLPGRLRCPLIRKKEETINAFNYAGNQSIYTYYPKVQFAGIPAPSNIVPLAQECYATSFYATVHVFMTLWGTKDGLGSTTPSLEVLRKREEESRRAQYHGGGLERSLLVFYLDGHVAPFAPVLRNGIFDAGGMIAPSEWAAMKRRGTWTP